MTQRWREGTKETGKHTQGDEWIGTERGRRGEKKSDERWDYVRKE